MRWDAGRNRGRGEKKKKRGIGHLERLARETAVSQTSAISELARVILIDRRRGKRKKEGKGRDGDIDPRSICVRPTQKPAGVMGLCKKPHRHMAKVRRREKGKVRMGKEARAPLAVHKADLAAELAPIGPLCRCGIGGEGRGRIVLDHRVVIVTVWTTPWSSRRRKGGKGGGKGRKRSQLLRPSELFQGSGRCLLGLIWAAITATRLGKGGEGGEGEGEEEKRQRLGAGAATLKGPFRRRREKKD